MLHSLEKIKTGFLLGTGPTDGSRPDTVFTRLVPPNEKRKGRREKKGTNKQETER
jgi:hypothetical protein